MKPATGNKALITIAVLLLVSIKILFLNHALSSETFGPQVLSDELLYRLNAESIFNKTRYVSSHYPPFYSLLLSVAFFSKNNWYQWMLYMNAILSSLVLIPVWFISLKFLPRTASLLLLLINSLSAFHFYYPGLIMSENLHVPIFAFSLYLLLDTERGTRSRKLIGSTLLGITMALGYMTKYLYFVAIPALIILWFIKPLFNDDPEERRITGPSRLIDLLSMFAGFILTWLPWIVYNYYSGSDIAGGMGAEFVLSGIREFAGLRSFVLWFSFYLSYGILALAPFLLVFIFYIVMSSSNKVKNDRQETFFILTVILLSIIFFMTAVQHSWRAGYNYPMPKRIIWRYVMHLMPLWSILFMMALNKLKNSIRSANLSQIISCFLLCLGAVFFALVMLVIVQDAQRLDLNFVNSPEGFMFRKKLFDFIFFLTLVAMTGILAASRRNMSLTKHYFLLFSILLVVIQASSAFTAYKHLLSDRKNYQLHGRALSSFILQNANKDHEKIVIASDQDEFILFSSLGRRVEQSIQFWVSTSMRKPSIKVVSFKEFLSHDGNWDGKLYRLTTNLTSNPIYNYMVKGEKYYIYDIATRPDN
jgi:4-amino-4-deoxy-L-arabinose transferase-like glycosyltransferase